MGVATAGQEEAALAGKKLYAQDWLLLNSECDNRATFRVRKQFRLPSGGSAKWRLHTS